MAARYSPAVAILMFVGCLRFGDHGIPRVSSITLPESKLEVILYGPVDDGEYFYKVFDPKSNHPYGSQSRELGSVHVDESAPPTVKEEAPGVYRITWGSGPNAAFAVIDVTKYQFVEDANPDNARNQPFVFEGADGAAAPSTH